MDPKTKHESTYIDNSDNYFPNNENNNNHAFDEPFPNDRFLETRLLKKVDRRLIPILGALYCIALVDRTNISVARISGLDQDLHLDVGDRASIALLVFFIGYVVFEIPSEFKNCFAGWGIFIDLLADH